MYETKYNENVLRVVTMFVLVCSQWECILLKNEFRTLNWETKAVLYKALSGIEKCCGILR